MSTLVLIAAVSYLLGSIPFGYLLVRMVRGEDVRQSGSGNIGATNVSRKSPALGVLTLLLDAAKGLAAVLLAVSLSRSATVASNQYQVMSLAALFSVAGHMFPVWLRFRGGKGVATGLGSFAIIAPKAVLIAAAIFVVVVLVFRYVSLGSVVAVALFPSLAWSRHEFGNSWQALACMGLASLLIVMKHHTNLTRLLAGTEHRIGDKRLNVNGEQKAAVGKDAVQKAGDQKP
ncbi:MAG TPA: glycerol-3-phosphate 1-O-acyltransferase PlsY [Terriglobales bacterium]|nr:glycerol-3-phosphate 1-O-acyltransferase PlsY [Terriglobales bacterium]